MFTWWLLGVTSVLAAAAIVFGAAILGGPMAAVVAGLAIGAVLLYGYVGSYVTAWRSIPVNNLVDIDGTPATAARTPFATTPNYVRRRSERNSRAFMIGMNAAATAALAMACASIDPLLISGIALWDFVIVSLSAVPALSRTRVFQGILGWTGWISPTSLVASLFGLVAFLINLPFAVASAIASESGNWWPVRLDWTTGVVETSGGGVINAISISTAAAGTAGHFSFVLAPFRTDPATVQQSFTPTGPALFNPSAHEVGHSLDYVAFGGLRNLLAAVDQLLFNNRATAYTELTADSHVPTRGRFQVSMWS